MTGAGGALVPAAHHDDDAAAVGDPTAIAFAHVDLAGGQQRQNNMPAMSADGSAVGRALSVRSIVALARTARAIVPAVGCGT
jgi:hypothetical protein